VNLQPVHSVWDIDTSAVRDMGFADLLHPTQNAPLQALDFSYLLDVARQASARHPNGNPASCGIVSNHWAAKYRCHDVSSMTISNLAITPVFRHGTEAFCGALLPLKSISTPLLPSAGARQQDISRVT
jgi:hypothetical protein